MRAKSPPLACDELFDNICRSVRALTTAIPVPLILENLDYCPGGAYEHICEPEFIAAVLETTGVGLLHDLAHARVSAAGHGLPIRKYLAGLPLERVRQLHIHYRLEASPIPMICGPLHRRDTTATLNSAPHPNALQRPDRVHAMLPKLTNMSKTALHGVGTRYL